ncbi:hypothetical protein D3C80_1268910 [compost metagenome]
MADGVQIENRTGAGNGLVNGHEVDQQRLACAVIVGDVLRRQLLAAGHDPVIFADVVQRRQCRTSRAVQSAVQEVSGLPRLSVRTDLPFPQQVCDRLMRAIGLVLIDEERGVVEVLGRYLVARIGHAVGIDAGSGHDIGARRRDREGRRPDRHIARRALVDEVQAVVEILAEGGQQGRAAEGVGRALLDAVAVIVLVRDQVRDLTGRQGGLAHARSAVRVIGVGQADEGLAGVGQIGVGDIIAQAGSIPDQAVAHHLQQIAEVLLVHRQVESAV